MTDPHLTAEELHQLWLTVAEERRLAFISSLEECCWQRLARYQVDMYAARVDLSDRPRRRARGSVSPTISLASIGVED